MPAPDPVSAFLQRWSGVTGSERANYQLFIGELCRLLEVPAPDPARDDTRDNAYVFERRVTFAHGDGSTSAGYIDCYRRGTFVLEAKKVKAAAETKGFDDALMRARAQAEGYARALPAAEGRPPFLVIVDVGHVVELYAEFTRSGATYTPFPDARTHRLKLVELRDEVVRERLRTLWLDPMALDPSRVSAKVTRDVAVQLAALARSLEADGHSAEKAAAFLTRCLFSMFAEDVGLLPKDDSGQGAFVDLLERWRNDSPTLQKLLAVLWTDMDRGGFSATLARDVLRFNGKLFKGSKTADFALPLKRDQIDLLLLAAKSNWREVEPAIFGTLLEWALDPAERRALGAHYTPRGYVERLVLPTVVEPLRADWADSQAAALLLANEANRLVGKKREDKLAEARAEIRRFHHALCSVRVLDPACGSGNFLYVTLEHLKRLEGEVFAQLEALGDTQSKLGLEGETVTLKQLLGIEINERASALAELVLWIGYLQWHIRTFGNTSVAEPVIHDYGNVEHRDALLDYDAQVRVLDAQGKGVTRWDGMTFKFHPVTGEKVPDEKATVPQWRYLNSRAAKWPSADFIIGNPPFVGNKRMRDSLGSGYVEALRDAHPRVPESADLVMFWWQKAAEQTLSRTTRRFGLISTNSIRQSQSRALVQQYLESGSISLAFAVPDHPWVESGTGAAVRISMTVGRAGAAPGRLLTVVSEQTGADGEATVQLNETVGRITSALSIGTDVSDVAALKSNAGLSFMGIILVGNGFFLDGPEGARVARAAAAREVLSKYVSGSDLARRLKDRLVVDFTGLDEEAARARCPEAYQWIFDRVKPLRDQSNDRTFRSQWWLFGRSRPRMREALEGLTHYIATARTAKHRIFLFLDSSFVAESNVVVVAHSDALLLGVLSSALHAHWAERLGATLEDRPHYTNSTVFEPFPFPSDDTGLTDDLAGRIRNLADQLDAHRKARQAAYDDVTLTGLYNVLSKLRAEESLTDKEKVTHERGLVAVLRSLHDELDAAVLRAYGWSDLQSALADYRPDASETRSIAVEMLLERLVTLNAKRVAEEAAGNVRWLRPDFQARARQSEQTQIDLQTSDDEVPAVGIVRPIAKSSWPTGLAEQIKAVAGVMSNAGRPLTMADLEASFSGRGRWRERLPTIVETLIALGRMRPVNESLTAWEGA